MKNTLLTSTDFVKSNTNISDNISDKYLLATIKEAQNEDLRGVVGDALLNFAFEHFAIKSIGKSPLSINEMRRSLSFSISGATFS
jgi:hypothetical protein